MRPPKPCRRDLIRFQFPRRQKLSALFIPIAGSGELLRNGDGGVGRRVLDCGHRRVPGRCGFTRGRSLGIAFRRLLRFGFVAAGRAKVGTLRGIPDAIRPVSLVVVLSTVYIIIQLQHQTAVGQDLSGFDLVGMAILICIAVNRKANSSFLKPSFLSSFQICSIGFISGVYGGIKNSSMFSGTISPFDLCQAAPSQHNKIISSGYSLANSRRNTFVQSVLQYASSGSPLTKSLCQGAVLIRYPVSIVY